MKRFLISLTIGFAGAVALHYIVYQPKWDILNACRQLRYSSILPKIEDLPLHSECMNFLNDGLNESRTFPNVPTDYPTLAARIQERLK